MKLIDDLHAGKWVCGFDPDVWEMLLEAEELCFQLNHTSPRAIEERKDIFRRIVGRVVEPFTLHSPFRCDFGKHIFIGRNFVGNYNLTILDEGIVTIGDNVFIGPNTSIYTINHAVLPEQRNVGVMRALPVTIGNNVWIGGNVVVLPGVIIGDGAVVAAGSVVTRDIDAGAIVAGNPAKVKRFISEEDRVEPEV